MIDFDVKFKSDGFVVINGVLNEDELFLLSQKCDAEIEAKVGTRNLLQYDWVRELAQSLIENESLKLLMPENAVIVQCNYFSKDLDTNWSVTLHRDLSVPVKEKVISNDWSGWSEKEGVLYAQPPKHVLSEMIAVRLHLEDNDSKNGALELVAGSHKKINQNGERHLALVAQGGVLVMCPLVLHASTKLKFGKRRVLHFVFGPKKLPNNVAWANAIPQE